jgi:hypothetical protein
MIVDTVTVMKALAKKLGPVTNIWNIKQQHRTKLLSMFFAELKPALNNKDLFNVENI